MTAVAGETASQDLSDAESESFLDGLINTIGDWLDFGTSDEPVTAAEPAVPGDAQSAETEGGLLSVVPFAGKAGANLACLTLVALLLLVVGFGLRRIQRRRRA